MISFLSNFVHCLVAGSFGERLPDHQANKGLDDFGSRVFVSFHFGGTNTPVNLQADFSTLIKMGHCLGRIGCTFFQLVPVSAGRYLQGTRPLLHS